MIYIIPDIFIRLNIRSTFVMNMKLRPIHIFTILCLAFIAYTLSIYFSPLLNSNLRQTHRKAADGRLVWQKYNCQACHQLYGLGGYLGPDLTNVYSTKGKGEQYIKAFVRSGTSQMPAFELSAEEEQLLIDFLKQTDASGTSDPRTFSVHTSGMIEAK